MPVRVLHIFDRWLNQTMNWAYHLIANTRAEHFIGADLFFQNPFDDRTLKIWIPPLQRPFSSSGSEWEIPLYQKWMEKAGGAYRHGFWRKQIHQYRIQVVHFHFATVAARHLDFALKCGLPMVVSFYGYDYERAIFNNVPLRKKYQRIFAEARAIVVEGENGRRILISQGCPAEKIHVVHLGIDVSTVVSFPKKAEGRLRLIQPASFVPKKGHLTTLGALQRLQELPHLSVDFIGEVGDRSYYQQVLKEGRPLMEKGILKILDFIPANAFDQALQNYHGIVQPSTYTADMDCEGGAPVSLIQAQYRGLPALATLHCDIPEVVYNGTGRHLVRERDESGLAQSILYLYNMDRATYTSLSRSVHTHIVTHYNIQNSGLSLRKVYDHVL